MHFVYILYSADIDRFYVGESADPEQRLAHHRAGHQRFTCRAADWTMVFRMPVSSRGEALEIETTIKQSKSRKSIVRWIRGPGNQVEPSVWQGFVWLSRPRRRGGCRDWELDVAGSNPAAPTILNDFSPWRAIGSIAGIAAVEAARPPSLELQRSGPPALHRQSHIFARAIGETFLRVITLQTKGLIKSEQHSNGILIVYILLITSKPHRIPSIKRGH